MIMSQRNAEFWSGRPGFVFATIGSAVGLGSIWKFPYEAGTGGGSAFVVAYIAGLVLVVAPLMLAEFAIGRRGGGDAAASLVGVAAEAGKPAVWGLVGSFGVLAGFLILSFYAVIGGWTLAYLLDALRGGLSGADPATVGTQYAALLADPTRMIIWHSVFIGLTALIVAGGVAHGIERACKVLMPLLIISLIGLTIHAAFVGDIGPALDFLFRFDPSRMSLRIALEALGLGFFSIGVGLGVMITYAARAKREIKLVEATAITLVADTAISLLAGVAIFSFVFRHGLSPASGPGLMFETLPIAFAAMPLGSLIGAAFFLVLAIAALASAVSLLELVTEWVMGRLGTNRRPAVVLAAAGVWTLGLGTVFSFNHWANWRPFPHLPGFSDASVFETLDRLTSNLMLPVGGMLLALFAGWIAKPALLTRELALSRLQTTVLVWILRIVVPAMIGVVLTGHFM